MPFSISLPARLCASLSLWARPGVVRAWAGEICPLHARPRFAGLGMCAGQQCLPSAVGIEGGEPMQPGTPGRGRELAAAAECRERKAGEKENCG